MNKFMRKSLELIDTLRPFPMTILRINHLLSDPFYSMNKLVDLIRYDAALTAYILKMANSPYFGTREKFSSIRQAVSYLGANEVQKMLFLHSVKPYFSGKQLSYEAEDGELWRSSIAGGMLAEIIAESLGYKDPQIAFTASLLRDIGKIVFSKIIAEHPEKRKELLLIENKSFDEREQLLFGITHPKIGASLLSRWKFSDQLIDAVMYHHDPFKSSLETTRIVALSDILGMLAGITTALDGLNYKSNNLQKEFNLSQQNIDTIMAKFITKYNSAIYEATLF